MSLQGKVQDYLSSPALQRATEVTICEGAQQLPGSWVHHQQAAHSLPSQLLQGLNHTKTSHQADNAGFKYWRLGSFGTQSISMLRASPEH